MEKFKKISLMFFLIILLGSINNIILANESGINETPYIESKIETKEVENEELEVTLTINNFKNIGDGVNAYTGILYYDNSELELEKVISDGVWNAPTYKVMENNKGAKIVGTSSEFLNKEGKVFTAIFKIKANKENYNIKFEKFEFAYKIDGTIQKVELSNANNKNDVKTENKNKSNKIIKQIVIILSIVLLIVVVITIISEVKTKGAKK